MTGLPALPPSDLIGGTFLARPFAPKEGENDNLDSKPSRFAARHDGFDVHCAVRIAADDDDGRERLVRSGGEREKPPASWARAGRGKVGFRGR